MSFIKSIKHRLSLEYEMTDLGNVSRFLGLQIRCDRSKKLLLVDQTEYIQTVLDRFQMSDCKSARTPLPAGVKIQKRVDNAPDTL